jgi:hypothetical protein
MFTEEDFAKHKLHQGNLLDIQAERLKKEYNLSREPTPLQKSTRAAEQRSRDILYRKILYASISCASLYIVARVTHKTLSSALHGTSKELFQPFYYAAFNKLRS